MQCNTIHLHGRKASNRARVACNCFGWITHKLRLTFNQHVTDIKQRNLLLLFKHKAYKNLHISERVRSWTGLWGSMQGICSGAFGDKPPAPFVASPRGFWSFCRLSSWAATDVYRFSPQWAEVNNISSVLSVTRSEVWAQCQYLGSDLQF